MRRLAAIGIALALLTGCENDAQPRATTPASPSPTRASASPLGPVTQRCGAPVAPATVVAPRTVDGVVLAGAEVGAGRRGVVLVPELGRSAMCGWWPYAVHLAGQGFHVLLFDQRCTGDSACPAGTGNPDELIRDVAAALTTLRAHGAGPVALVGASRGAAEVLIAGARAAAGDDAFAPVTAVAAFSPDLLDDQLAGPPFPTANKAAPRLRLPTLLAVAPGDPIAPVPDVQRLHRTIPAADKRLYVLEDQPTVHGWSLVSADPSTGRLPEISATLVAFLKKYTAS